MEFNPLSDEELKQRIQNLVAVGGRPVITKHNQLAELDGKRLASIEACEILLEERARGGNELLQTKVRGFDSC